MCTGIARVPVSSSFQRAGWGQRLPQVLFLVFVLSVGPGCSGSGARRDVYDAIASMPDDGTGHDATAAGDGAFDPFRFEVEVPVAPGDAPPPIRAPEIPSWRNSPATRRQTRTPAPGAPRYS